VISFGKPYLTSLLNKATFTYRMPQPHPPIRPYGRLCLRLGSRLLAHYKLGSTGTQAFCRFTSLDACSGTELHLVPYSTPSGLSTAFVPVDIRVRERSLTHVFSLSTITSCTITSLLSLSIDTFGRVKDGDE
jgi:hypothetical protein